MLAPRPDTVAEGTGDGGADSRAATRPGRGNGSKAKGRAAATEVYARLVREGRSHDDAKSAARQAYLDAAAEATGPGSTRPAVGPAAAVRPTGLVLSPTRELCEQTAAVFAELSRALGAGAAPPAMAIIGGENYVAQRARLFAVRPELVVATPGRLLSLCGRVPASSRARMATAGAVPPGTARAEASCGECAPDGGPSVAIELGQLKVLVLDEADRLLDLGFEEDVRVVVELVANRPWTMLLSATWDEQTALLATSLLQPGAVQIRIGAGERLNAARSVTQIVEVLKGKGAPRFRH